MKPITSIRVGLPTTLYRTICFASKRTGTSVAGLARSAIQRFIPRLEPVRIKRPAKRLDERKMQR